MTTDELLAEAHDTLNDILNWALANRGSDHVFVRCYTYEGHVIPYELKKAELLFEELHRVIIGQAKKEK